jgi:hypothetical protein
VAKNPTRIDRWLRGGAAMIAMALAISMTTMRVDMRTMMVMVATILVKTSLEVLHEVEATPLMEE